MDLKLELKMEFPYFFGQLGGKLAVSVKLIEVKIVVKIRFELGKDWQTGEIARANCLSVLCVLYL